MKCLRGKITLLYFTIFSVVVDAQTFDPNSVRSKDCKPGVYQCGYLPAPKEIQDTIPLKRDFNSFEELPSSIDLSSQMPPVGNQGQQNSCVAWASGYAIRSFLAKNGGKVSNYDPPFVGGGGNNVFSPAFIYNQQNGGKDAGLYYYKTMDFLQKNGVVPWSSMPYSDKDYKSQPSASAKQEALAYRIKSYTRLNIKKPDEIKRVLAGGNVVLFGIIIDDAFYQLKAGEIYDKTGGQSYGGHAMTIVGYDDKKKSKSGHVGAFKFQNSWGENWADKGFGWLSYNMLAAVGQEAYALVDDTKTNTSPTSNEVSLKPLSPPQQIKVSRGESDSNIGLSWEQVPGAISYLIQRREEGDSKPKDIAYSTTTNYLDSNLSPNTTYFYTLISISADTSSSPSTEVEGFTISKVNPNAKPQAVSGINGKTYIVNGKPQVALVWSALEGVSTYTVAKSVSGGKWKVLGTTPNTAYIDTLPSKDSINGYRIRATGKNKKIGPWSDTFGISIGDANAETAPTGQVSDLQASDGDYSDKIFVQWSEMPGATGYYVFRFDENAKLSKEFTVKSNSFEDKDAPILTGKYFSYTIYGYNSAGYSEQSEFVIGRAEPSLAKRAAGKTLAPPTSVSGSLDEKNKLTIVKWSSVKDASEYYIYRKLLKSTTSAVGKQLEFVQAVPGNKTEYSESFPGKPGDLFVYSVRSKSEFGGESKDSTLVSIFLNPQLPSVKKRALSISDLPQEFVGTWTGFHWNAKSGPQKITLELKSNHQDFNASLSINDKVMKTFSGSWTPGSTGVRSEGFSFDLQKEIPGNSLVQFPGLAGWEEDLELSLTKLDTK
ncbi:papain family cysteine protease [Leptospira ryugenii]|uniref:Papain family cysteine protease n=1 Tax=Leptospira ryugenii TaxID=1917863 RepID=A0A2P2E511_9LEPT|nr:C1 family peptidase [Leptospira ryugenii]GBF51959.1 papain family cysteine protease [Leptospira ryugenii]